MNVVPYDYGRYFVSVRAGAYYLVELDAFGVGRHFCGCKDFQMRHLPLLQKEQESGIKHTTKRQCKHLQALVMELAKLKEPNSQSERRELKSLAQETGSHNDSEAISESYFVGSITYDSNHIQSFNKKACIHTALDNVHKTAYTA
jgi:hypothetical protein